MSRRLLLALAAAGLAWLASAVACVQGQKLPTPNCVFIVTEAVNPPATTPGTVALMHNEELSSQMFPVFDLVVHGPVSKAYGMAFRLTYDPNVLAYTGRSLASSPAVFTADGQPVNLTVDAVTVPGTLIVGLSRLAGRVGGVDLAEAAHIVMRFNFRAAGAGSTAFAFAPGALVADENYGSTLTGVTGFTWVAGSVTTAKECL